MIGGAAASCSGHLDAVLGGLWRVDGIDVEKYTTTAVDGAQLDLFLYRLAATDQPGSAALFLTVAE